MKYDLTARQQQVLKFIQHYQTANGYSPSVRDIANFFGWRWTRSATCHLDALCRKGYTCKPYGLKRAIAIIKGSEVEGK